MVNIIPAILRPDLKSFEDDLIKVWQYVTRVQVDVVDGVFSSTTTMGPKDAGPSLTPSTTSSGT